MVWNTLYTSEYGYGTEHPVYIRVWLRYGTPCLLQRIVRVWNTLYTSEYGYGTEHPVYIRYGYGTEHLYTSGYGYGMECPVYFSV
jgi:hypothetical protein